MKLSEAIALGYAEITSDPITWLSVNRNTKYNDGKECWGCAIGAALYAMGHKESYSEGIYNLIERYWPWVVKSTVTINGKRIAFIAAISHYFALVHEKRMTIEQLIDWVRSLEPQETEVTERVEHEHDTANVSR